MKFTPTAAETLRDRVDALRRAFTPDPSKSLYLVSEPSDYAKTGSVVKVYTIWDSAQGDATLYVLIINKSKSATFEDADVDLWADWIKKNVPKILMDVTRPYLIRTSQTNWKLRGIMGWHFATMGKKRKVLPVKLRNRR
jgi:hypothetical protein